MAEVPTPTLRRFETCALVVLIALAVLIEVIGTPRPAASLAGTAGSVDVTVAPTSGLVDGQTISIHAQAQAGSDLFEIRAHQCVRNSAPMNRFKFSFEYRSCTPVPLSAASDAETAVAIPPGTGGTGDLAFRVGVGTSTWTTNNPPYDPPEGASHSLSCGPGMPCDLVVQLQVTDNTVFFVAPLCFGDCPAEPSDPSAAAPPPTGSSAAADAAADPSGESSSTPTSTTVAPPPPAAGKPQTGGPGSATGGASGGSGAAAQAATGSGSSDETGLAAAIVGSPEARRAVRVFSAGVAGVIGGLLIASILIRTRRRAGAPRLGGA